MLVDNALEIDGDAHGSDLFFGCEIPHFAASLSPQDRKICGGGLEGGRYQRLGTVQGLHRAAARQRYVPRKSRAGGRYKTQRGRSEAVGRHRPEYAIATADPVLRTPEGVALSQMHKDTGSNGIYFAAALGTPRRVRSSFDAL